jgi:hypothetical protein
MVIDAFGGTLGSQQSILGKNIKMTITVFGESDTNENLKMDSTKDPSDTEILQTFSGKYPNNKLSSRKVEVEFANLFMGEVRDVLVKLKVSPCLEPINIHKLLSAEATYVTMNDTQKQAIADVDSIGYDEMFPSTAFCVVKRLIDEDPSPIIDVEVDAQKNRNCFLDVVASANTLAERGDFSKAEEEIQRCKDVVMKSVSAQTNNIVSKSILEDLEETHQRLKDKHLYRQNGGTHVLNEYVSNYSGQRVTYKKAAKSEAFNPYQNVSSVAIQKTASDFKSKRMT